MNDNDIRAASLRELDELDDALVSDDDRNRNGFGEVLWITANNRVLHRPLQ